MPVNLILITIVIYTSMLHYTGTKFLTSLIVKQHPNGIIQFPLSILLGLFLSCSELSSSYESEELLSSLLIDFDGLKSFYGELI